jgi:hypothetical protein
MLSNAAQAVTDLQRVVSLYLAFQGGARVRRSDGGMGVFDA